MTAGELCVRSVVTAQKSDTIVEAARAMRSYHTGSVVVVEGEGPTPVGILTDRDLVVGVLADVPQDITRLQVGDVLVDPVITAQEDELIHVILRRMRAHGIRRVPVVDQRGVLVGVLAFDDVVDFIAEEMGDLAALLRNEAHREEELRVRSHELSQPLS